MLNEEVINKVSERLVNRIEQGNEYVLNKIGESVKKIGTLKNTDVHDLEQILKYGGSYEDIVRKLAKITKLNVKDIKKIFEEVAKSDYEFAEKFYKYRNVKYIPFDENTVLKNQVNALATETAKEFFKLTNRKVLGFGIVDKKTGKVKFKGLKRAYYDLIDEGILNISQGKETFNNIMYKRLKELGESGLKVIYESGATRRLDSAVRMNIKDGVRMLHQEVQKQIGKEFDADGVEITVHLNPAPDHMYVQGRQFTNDEFEKFQNDKDSVSYDGIEFPAESEETGRDRRSIGEYNCYHDIYSIVLGVNEPQYTNEELQEIINQNEEGFDFEGKRYTMYEGTQLQRQIETKIRESKEQQILGRSSGIEELAQESQKKINLLTKKYNKLNKISGLQPRTNRMRISGYKRIAIKK